MASTSQSIYNSCLENIQKIDVQFNVNEEMLNPNQCKNLQKVLHATMDAIQRLLPTLPPSTPSIQLEGLLKHELYQVVLKAKDLLESCRRQE
jgi:hypothetical protein